MGTFSPSPFYNDEVEAFCEKYVYQSTIDAMASEGRPFTGILFTGLMITEDGPKSLRIQCTFWRSRSTGCSSKNEEMISST